MVRSKLLILALALPVLAAHAADKAVAVKQPAAKTQAAQPVRIVRNAIQYRPPKMQHTATRVLPKAQYNQFIQAQLNKLRLNRPFPPPGQRALLIILENQGIMNNVDPTLRARLDVNIRTATCGNFEFELIQGESIQSFLTRVGAHIVGNLACLDPNNWRITNFNPLHWLNEQTDLALENAVKANGSLVNTQAYYDRVVVLEDEDAVPDRVVAMIRSLAPDYVIDIHVLTHGNTERFVGYNNVAFNAATFFNPLQADKNAGRLYIRAVYQMNCRSGTLKDNWTALGAITVNGTEGTNLNNLPFQYFHWLTHWLDRMGHADASRRAFEEASFYAMPIYSLVGQGSLINVSRLTAVGPSPNANVVSHL